MLRATAEDYRSYCDRCNKPIAARIAILAEQQQEMAYKGNWGAVGRIDHQISFLQSLLMRPKKLAIFATERNWPGVSLS